MYNSTKRKEINVVILAVVLATLGTSMVLWGMSRDGAMVAGAVIMLASVVALVAARRE